MSPGAKVEFLASEAARRHAWKRIVTGLAELAAAPEVLASPGAYLFVNALEEVCDDIGQHLTKDSLPEAMKKLAAGFGRFGTRRQQAGRAAAREWVRQQWDFDRGGFATKTEFAEVFVKRVFNEFNVQITEKVLKDDWLKKT